MSNIPHEWTSADFGGADFSERFKHKDVPGTPPKPSNCNGDLANLPHVFKGYMTQRVWVGWKWVWNAARDKWDKPPYLLNGKGNASSTNPATWGTHAEALAAFQAGLVDGIGIALQGLSGGEIFLDLDKCRNPETGEINAWAKELVELAASYTEVTPSGTGLRVIGKARIEGTHRRFNNVDEAGSSLEVYTCGEGRYVTVTGRENDGRWPHLGDITDLAQRLVRDKGRLHPAQAETSRDEQPKAEKPFEPAPGYKPGWFADAFGFTNGHGRRSQDDLMLLIAQGVPEGQRSEKFHHAVGWAKRIGWTLERLEQVMRQYPTGIASKYLTPDRLTAEIKRCWGKVDERSDYDRARDEARRAGAGDGTASGQEGPKAEAGAGRGSSGAGATGSAGPESGARGAPIHPMLKVRAYNENVTLPRMIVPGFIGAGITIIAGYQGIGKTTAVLPLAAIVAGINVRLMDPLQPRHWRNVVYISEDMDQVDRILAAIAKDDSQATKRIKERFKLVEAAGLPAEHFVEVGAKYHEMHRREVDGVTIPPLVVIDTKSAAFEVKDENDNAEASAIMRALKMGFAGLPTWVIGHIAKANMNRANAAEMSLRGASSFEGDANQVVFLLAEDERRYLVRGKTRFEARWKEVEVITETFDRDAVDEFGEPGKLILRRATFVPLSTGEREKKAEERKADLRDAEDQNRVDAILKVVREAREAGEMINRENVARKVGGNKAKMAETISRLVDEGAFAELELPGHLRTHPRRKAFLIDLEGDEQAAYRATGEVPEEKVEQVNRPFAEWRREQRAARGTKGSRAAGSGTGGGVKNGEGDAM